MTRYVAIDNETGGIEEVTSLLTSYLGVFDENFKLIDELYLYTKPNDGNYVVTAEGLRINRINLVEHEKVAITYKEAGTKLYEFLRKNSMDGKIFLAPVGHNVGFDIAGLQLNLLGRKTWNRFVSYRLNDTGCSVGDLIHAGIIPNTVKGSLGSCLEYFDLLKEFPKETLHDAKVDALASLAVYQKCQVILRTLASLAPAGFNSASL